MSTTGIRHTNNGFCLRFAINLMQPKQSKDRPQELISPGPASWANGLSPAKQAEWLVDCYRMRVDYAWGGECCLLWDFTMQVALSEITLDVTPVGFARAASVSMFMLTAVTGRLAGQFSAFYDVFGQIHSSCRLCQPFDYVCSPKCKGDADMASSSASSGTNSIFAL